MYAPPHSTCQTAAARNRQDLVRHITGYSVLMFAKARNHQQYFNVTLLTQRLCLPCCGLVKYAQLQVWSTERYFNSQCVCKGRQLPQESKSMCTRGMNDETHSAIDYLCTLRCFCSVLGRIGHKIICPATERSQAATQPSSFP